MAEEARPRYRQRKASIDLEALAYFKPRNHKGRMLRLDPFDAIIFDYIRRLNDSKSRAVDRARDPQGRPWVNIEALCEALDPLLCLRPHSVSERIRKMATMRLLDRSTRKVVVRGIGARQVVHARPSDLYRAIVTELDRRHGSYAASLWARARLAPEENV